MRRLTGLWLTTAGVALAIGCSPASEPTEQVATAGSGHVHLAAPERPISAAAERQLAEVKDLFAGFGQFGRAKERGYGTPITACLADPVLGGMGFHYGNTTLIDGVVDYRRPEVVLYAPHSDGRLELVAIEYIVPFTAWTRSEPPVLFGQPFQRNLTFQVWALHAWLYRTNPSGLFAPWNPTVSCPAN